VAVRAADATNDKLTYAIVPHVRHTGPEAIIDGRVRGHPADRDAMLLERRYELLDTEGVDGSGGC